MGTGDLNLLKSWNPHLLKNKKKVWETEQQLLDENKKFKERQQEIENEREQEELTSLTRDGNVRKKKSTLDWMYNDAASTDYQNSDFLLGKKRIDHNTLTAPEKTTEKASGNRRRFHNDNKGVDSITKQAKSPTAGSFSRDDPLAAFQKAQVMRKQHKAAKVKKPLPKKQSAGKAQSQAMKSHSLEKGNTSYDMDY
ncbi:LANO_0G02982g1_1 [Lachancea nothofagi CBS 11611]|uniref:Pre-mRNA-splicing factor CWC25 n=1 Tax=Lachancea nothofagi CBS 11611 TaxID=1266666 RepID=A0A1G4KF99_9SACH|nr:LANO_0G02982g1_1 [Lachancea nothofagi CBS 11611]